MKQEKKLNLSVIGELFAAAIPWDIHFLVSKGLIIASTQILAAEYSTFVCSLITL